MNVLGLIPARGGSKTVPNKNIAILNGKPLLAYTVEAARNSKKLSRIVLSTDDEKIAAIGKKLGVEVPTLRPAVLAQDDTPMLPVIIHMFDFLRAHEAYTPDVVVLLQPTSPLRQAAHIDAAVDLLLQTGADSVVSVAEVPHQFHPLSVMHREDDGTLRRYQDGPVLMRRQDKPRLYGRNGPAVLAITYKTIVGKKDLYGDDSRGYVMKPEESLDIDTPFDFELAGWMLKKLV